MTHVLIIDDEREVCTFLEYFLSSKGFTVKTAFSGQQSDLLIDQHTFQLAMIDVKLPDTDGFTILKKLKEKQPHCKVIVMTGFSTVKTAVEAIKLGANDYIEKPFDDLDQLEALIDEMLSNDVSIVQNEAKRLAQEVGFITGNNEEMEHLITIAYKIAKKNINVLIQGETGTGKEVLAKYIHEASRRANETFLGVNCGALSESLLESELFGHEKGAFTGATQLRKGLFELANSGTLFLDEIAEASPAIQVKLLRVLETREFMRVGSEKIFRTNARIIAASHVNLEEAVIEKKFRQDLLYRLNVVKLEILPLRKRKEDIPLLINYFLEKYDAKHLTFTNEAMELLENYHWPGNIRELVNVVTRAITLSEGETTQITKDYLPRSIQNAQNTEIEEKIEVKKSFLDPINSREKTWKDPNFNNLKKYLDQWNAELLLYWQSEQTIPLEIIKEKIKELENVTGKAFIKKALISTMGNRKEAAKLLKITPRQLRYLLTEKKHYTQ
ncbi:sigma-54-dependent transcriptional regulator [Calidifontibacillus erzurumensis]|uniref:Sigma-54-dependent Fis family transcriptional regulator n=1 Tax=Calidifontibacillus erzurumensis TaxID=2741433 RepID=A0A8J8KFP0_9BACI|nr:sigma-54 dependent transcriptional regulator [Calidifontibacillus erzurumensis]NSL53125.1 sigma-54-dependent Fis family transcriptional regulator [Calidifontibacillus erzurumensis]